MAMPPVRRQKCLGRALGSIGLLSNGPQFTRPAAANASHAVKRNQLNLLNSNKFLYCFQGSLSRQAISVPLLFQASLAEVVGAGLQNAFGGESPQVLERVGFAADKGKAHGRHRSHRVCAVLAFMGLRIVTHDGHRAFLAAFPALR